MRRKTSSTAANTAAPASTLNAAMRIIECFVVEAAIASELAPLSASSGVPASFDETTHASDERDERHPARDDRRAAQALAWA